MAQDIDMRRVIIDRDRLPAQWPTHRHAPEFWEQLGRTVATYGFLEEVLGKAIFALTATRHFKTEDEALTAYERWLPTLEKALTDTLKPLADTFGKVARENPDCTTENIDEIVTAIKKASETRNVICHGSWRPPDTAGRSQPFFVNRKKEIFDTSVDIAYLCQLQKHVAELAASVIDTITHMGYQFPGGGGPGRPIWNGT